MAMGLASFVRSSRAKLEHEARREHPTLFAWLNCIVLVKFWLIDFDVCFHMCRLIQRASSVGCEYWVTTECELGDTGIN